MSDDSNNLPTILSAETYSPSKDDDEHERDLAYARDNLIGAIEKAQKGLEELGDVAYSAQNSRAYEVQHQYLKTLSELNKDFVAISKEKNAPKIAEATKSGKVQNNLFVGSTAELAKMLKKIKDDA